MRFSQPLVPGRLVRRYKRFLADVSLSNGSLITAHCPNSGSMKSCDTAGWEVMLSRSDKPGRRYPFTWEMVHNGRCWIGINTSVPNTIVAEAIRADAVPELRGYKELRREQRYGRNSRIDILLEGDAGRCYIEVKNVTLVEGDGIYYFPDAVTERGRKHLNELSDMVKSGDRGVMFFVVQRSDGKIFKPAVHIDPAYAEALNTAQREGVEILVYQAAVSPGEILLDRPVEWMI